MIVLLISWLFAGWLSLAFGVFALKSASSWFKEDAEPALTSGLDYTLLAGFILVTAFTSIVTLFSPVNTTVTLLFAGAGAGLTYAYRSEWRRILASVVNGWRGMGWPLKMGVTAVFLICMASVTMEFGESDVWFYHSQAIKWIKEYAVVPGLGNIHGRFAFNSHFFISSALFTLWFSEDQVVFPLLSLFFFIFNIRLLVNIRSSMEQKNWFFLVFNAILFLSCTFQFFSLIHGTATDEMTSILLIYGFLAFLSFAYESRKTSSLLFFWALMLTTVTYKLSSIFACILLLFTLPRIFRQKRIGVFFATGLLVLGPFIARNIYLSGYLAYPVPQVDVLNVDWKIPMKEVILEKELVEGWARLLHGGADIPVEDIPKILEVPFKKWIVDWWPTRSMKWRIIMVLNLFNIGLLGWLLIRKDYKKAILCLTILFNLGFWFIEAPDPRFGFAFLLSGLSLLIAHLATPVFRFVRPNQYLLVPLTLVMVGSLFLKTDVRHPSRPLLPLLWKPEYQMKIQPKTFEAINFKLNVPPDEPPAKGIWCYNAPLPCTPYPKKDLMMRGKDFQDGFRIARDTGRSHQVIFDH